MPGTTGHSALGQPGTLPGDNWALCPRTTRHSALGQQQQETLPQEKWALCFRTTGHSAPEQVGTLSRDNQEKWALCPRTTGHSAMLQPLTLPSNNNWALCPGPFEENGAKTFPFFILSSPSCMCKVDIHPLNGPLSRTTQVSRYQIGKSNLDLTGARDSEWQWHQLGRMQVCTSLQTDNHASTPSLSFLQAGCPSCRPTNSIKAVKACMCKVDFHETTLQLKLGTLSETSRRISTEDGNQMHHSEH